MPPGRGELVVMVNFGWMVTVRVFDAVCCGKELSVTSSDTLNVPDAAGVPVTKPSPDTLRLDDGSMEPDHEYGGVPPVTANAAAVYAVPTAPPGKVLLVIDKADVIVMVNVFVAVCG